MSADAERVTVTGLRALKERGLVGRITGYGRNRDNLERAKSLGIIDEAAAYLEECSVSFHVPLGLELSLGKDLIKGRSVSVAFRVR